MVADPAGAHADAAAGMMAAASAATVHASTSFRKVASSASIVTISARMEPGRSCSSVRI
jgi:hypothetical protein